MHTIELKLNFSPKINKIFRKLTKFLQNQQNFPKINKIFQKLTNFSNNLQKLTKFLQNQHNFLLLNSISPQFNKYNFFFIYR